jgi:peroxiredoxin
MPERRLNRKKEFPLPLVIVGLGLVLLGVAAFALLSQSGPAAQTEPLSTIPIQVNYAAPELSLTDIEGTPASLSDYRGQVLLVNLWATWCPPCKKEMPTLLAFHDAHRAAGFTLVAINDGDPAADVAQFVKDYELTFPVWLDPKHQASEEAFKSMNLPSSYVIDREGVIRLQWVGEITYAVLEKYVTPLIME